MAAGRAGTALACALAVAAALSGYSVAVAQQRQAAESVPPAPTPSPVERPSIAGYVHDLSRSQFKIGANVVIETDTPTLRRWRGALGAWAIDPLNGFSMGLLNARAPAGPYILDEAVQRDRVKAYFVNAGLPADQIRDVTATFEVRGGGSLATAESPSPIQLHSITSILRRSIDGIPVPESVAWAKMTASGDIDFESVFWPPIDAEIVDRAVAFARRISDSAAHAAYLAKLPGQIYREGGVVIHHTNPSVHATPIAYVSYDATLSPEGYAAMRHFDENGDEFRLLHEQATPPRGRRILPRP